MNKSDSKLQRHPVSDFKNKTAFFYAISVWLVGCSFFIMDYFIRVSPSLMTTQLMSTFNVGALFIGGLSAIFLYPYVLLQPFVGALIDRHGPYRLLVLACILSALGALIFSAAQHLSILYLGRFILGFSCSLSFIGTLKLVSNWFAPKYFALLAGLTQAFGMLGAFLGDSPLEYLYQTIGWRKTMLGSAAVFFIIACLILFLVRDYPRGSKTDFIDQGSLEKTPTSITSDVYKLLSKRPIWLNALYNGCLYAPIAAFAGLWGVPFLRVVEHSSMSVAASQVSVIFIGVAIGAPVCGVLSTRFKIRLQVMRVCAIVLFALTLLIIYGDNLFSWDHLSNVFIYSLFIVYGFFAGGVIPSYDYAADHSAEKHRGTALGLTNLASIGIGALLMPLIGWILDATWQGEVLKKHVFNTHNYHYALAVLPMVMLLAIVFSFSLTE